MFFYVGGEEEKLLVKKCKILSSVKVEMKIVEKLML